MNSKSTLIWIGMTLAMVISDTLALLLFMSAHLISLGMFAGIIAMSNFVIGVTVTVLLLWAYGYLKDEFFKE